jgi:hypothetical protein
LFFVYGKKHGKADGLGRRFSVVAICDKELLGKTLRQGEAVLDLKLHQDFYKGERISEETAVEWIKNSRNLNLVGEKTMAAAKKAIDVNKASVRKISGVPHLQVYHL